jgi:hypothetical protein
LKELVGYVHLNPLRARIVSGLKELSNYPYCGHSAILGKRRRAFQDVGYVMNGDIGFNLKVMILNESLRELRGYLQLSQS